MDINSPVGRQSRRSLRHDSRISLGNGFRFLNLPSELRVKIWNDTWEPRVVDIVRYHDVHETLRRYFETHQKDFKRKSKSNTASTRDPDWFDTWKQIVKGIAKEHTSYCLFTSIYERELQQRQSRAVMLDWDSEELSERIDIPLTYTHSLNVDPKDRYIFATITTSRAKPPSSLWVNRESRLETMAHYELCFGLDGGETRVWFNFDLDALLVNGCGVDLWSIYHRRDLIRLQKAVIWAAFLRGSDEELHNRHRRFCEDAIRTHVDRPVATVMNSFPRRPTRALQPRCDLTGVNLRFPRLRVVLLLVDRPESDMFPHKPRKLKHPVRLDIKSPKGLRGGIDDFRYYAFPDEASSALKQWDMGHFTQRTDLGAVMYNQETAREALVREYCVNLTAGVMGAAHDPFMSPLPDDWSLKDAPGRFACKVSLFRHRHDERVAAIDDGEPRYARLSGCKVAFDGSPHDLMSDEPGEMDPVVTPECRRLQLWNEITSWICKVFMEEVSMQPEFKLELGGW